MLQKVLVPVQYDAGKLLKMKQLNIIAHYMQKSQKMETQHTNNTLKSFCIK